jgi:hypothetical protein
MNKFLLKIILIFFCYNYNDVSKSCKKKKKFVKKFKNIHIYASIAQYNDH